MNALFAPGFKGFLTLLQAQDTVCQDHGDGAQGRDGQADARVEFGGHVRLYRPVTGFSQPGVRPLGCANHASSGATAVTSLKKFPLSQSRQRNETTMTTNTLDDQVRRTQLYFYNQMFLI